MMWCLIIGFNKFLQGARGNGISGHATWKEAQLLMTYKSR